MYKVGELQRDLSNLLRPEAACFRSVYKVEERDELIVHPILVSRVCLVEDLQVGVRGRY
jgi:hypothetical protein